MKGYDRILRAVYSLPWAIQPEKLEAIIGFLQLKAAGGVVTDELLANIQAQSAAMEARMKANVADGRGVAILPLYGLIMHRGNMMGDISGPRGTSTEKFAADFRAALNDPAAKAIVIDIDSPGGTVDGVPELAAEILAARGKKPVTAVANSLMASAAYWIGSAADEIVASPSALVGSIGVYTAHTDQSEADAKEGTKTTLISAGKYKVDGNPFEPLTDSARAHMQEMVNEVYDQFIKSVASGRKTTQTAVRDGFGEGRAVSAQKAVKAGMADRIATLDEVLAEYGVQRGSKSDAKVIRSEQEAPPIAANAGSGGGKEMQASSDHELMRRRFEIAGA